MKTMIRLLSLVALAAAFALPALAQDPAATTTPAATPNTCEEQARTDLYTQYYENKNKKDAKGVPDVAAQKQAFDIGQQFLAKYEATCKDKYTDSVKKYVTAYQKADRDFRLSKSWENKQYAETVAVSKEILADNPDDVKTAVIGAWAAYTGSVPPSNNTALTADALTLTQRALQLLEAGKTADTFLIFTNKDDALSWMNYAVAALNLKNNPTEATKYLVKVAQANGTAKQEPTTYSYLAFAYEKEYAKLFDEYKAKYPVETPESQVALANINLVVDRIIDAYARAVAFSKGNDPRRAEWMKTLTELYKSRHADSPAGLDEMLASITTKPLLLTTPVTTPPVTAAPAEGAAPTNGDGTAKPPASTTTTTPASTGTPPKPAAQPTPTPTPNKKPPVRQ